MFFKKKKMNEVKQYLDTLHSSVLGLKEDHQELLSTKQQYEKILVQKEKKERILQGIKDISKELNNFNCIYQSFPKILELLGKNIGVDRVYIFKNNEQNLATSQKYEWCAPNVMPQINNPDLQNVQYSKIPRWKEFLSSNHPICGQIKDFPDQEKEILESQGICSLCAVPIFSGKDWWGFIGFDVCDREKVWTFDEENLLSTIAELIGISLQTKGLYSELKQRNYMIEETIDKSCIYIWRKDKLNRFEYCDNRWKERFFGIPSSMSIIGMSEKDTLNIFSKIHNRESEQFQKLTSYTEGITRQREKETRFFEIFYLGSQRIVLDVNKIPLYENGDYIGVVGVGKEKIGSIKSIWNEIEEGVSTGLIEKVYEDNTNQTFGFLVKEECNYSCTLPFKISVENLNE